MARALRIEYPGATYHVMCRGNGGAEIFLDDTDRTRFLETLAEACERTGWIVHAYVLMPNHYHMLLETAEANLVAGMKWFQQTYTQRFNSRHKRWGHVYQGRYKALNIDGEEPEYFNVVSTYIHLNPVRAKLCCRDDLLLERYRWSSYPLYLKAKRHRPGYLEVQRVLESFRIPRDDARGRARYKAYVRERIGDERDARKRAELDAERKPLRRGWFLGGERFERKLLNLIGRKVAGGAHDAPRGEMRRAHGQDVAVKAVREGLRRLEVKENELGKMKKNAPEKQVIAWWLRKHTVAQTGWIAEQLKMGHVVNVSRAVQSIDRSKSRETKKLKKKMLECMS